MPALVCTRRCLLVSTSLAMTAGAASVARYRPAPSAAPLAFISAERADNIGPLRQALVLEGPRIERLQIMADSLPKISGKVILRLDPVDDQLLDVAAQQMGVSVRRGVATADALGVVGHVVPQQRSFA